MSSNSTESQAPPKAAPSFVPFFCDFDKKTNAFWKKSNYSLGHQFEIKAAPTDKSCVKVSVKDGPNVDTSVTTNFRTDWGNIEVVEDSKYGLSVEVDVDNIFRQWSLKSKHCSSDIEVTAEHRPDGSFWCTELNGKYFPNSDGERVCRSKASIVVQDSHYNLAVGGEVELEDRSDGTKPPQYDKLLKSYSMGFLYSPTELTQYSLIYTPDNDSNGVKYDFSLFKQVSEKLSVAGRAEGKADLRNTSLPTISLGASWLNNGILARGFVNSRREYGASYQVKLAPQAQITLGLGSFLSLDDDDAQAKVGFKLCFS